MGGVGHWRFPPLGPEPTGCTPTGSTPQNFRARTVGNAAAPKRAVSRLAARTLGLSRALWLDQWGYPQSRGRHRWSGGSAVSSGRWLEPSWVCLGLGCLAVESVLSRARCRGVLREQWRRGRAWGNRPGAFLLPWKGKVFLVWVSALARKSDKWWRWWGSQALVGLLLSGLGEDSDALTVIPWVPGNYSNNLCLEKILTINPLYWQRRLADGLPDSERNKADNGRGRGDTSRLSSDSKETSSFSVVCEGVTAKVFVLLGS